MRRTTVATRRRRTSNADDIRARLGIEEAPEPEPEVIPEPDVEAETASAGAAGPAVAAASDYAHEDYASAVAEPEDAPVEAPQEDWRSEDPGPVQPIRSEEHTSELQSRGHLVCRL